jgi:tetratricopeptide (TPR) repeat protein
LNEAVNVNALLGGAIIGVVSMALATLLVLLLHGRQRKKSQSGDTSYLASAAVEPDVSPRNPAGDIVETSKRIEAATADGDNGALAALYLDLARCHGLAGDEASRLSALRSAATYGSQHGPHAAHAEARIELAEIAFRAGDLTSACEQWQMARAALLKDGQTERHASIEKRMRENGCPTDWVLTGF